MMSTDTLEVTVVYAPRESYQIIPLTVPQGTTVTEVVALSKLADKYPEISDLPVGIYGKKVKGSDVVEDQDRIEIYRPLSQDAMAARRQRAKDKNKK